MSAPSVANPDRFPSAAFRSWPPPSRVISAASLIHARNACFVSLSKIWRISSSSTVGSICVRLRVWPSLIFLADDDPGVSST